jgi:DNA invertase Pin-like site-specific DNA recombinase
VIIFNPKIWAYGRVSSLEQAENSHALEQQLDRLEKAGVDRAHILYDVESGAEIDRAGFNKLMASIERGEVTEVFATRWDRLMRNSMLYEQFKEIVQKYGVQIRLLDQGAVDFGSASGLLQADLQSLFAVYERNMLRERIARGHKYRRQRLAAPARPPWGYVVVDETYKLNRKPCVCVIADRPADYSELYHATDDSPRLAGLSKADIAREVVETLLQTRFKAKTLGWMRERYGIPKTKCYQTIIDENGVPKRKMLRKSIVFLDQLEFWSSPGDLAEWVLNPVLIGHTAYMKYTNNGPTQRMKAPDEWELHPNTHPGERLLSDQELEEIKLILKPGVQRARAAGTTFYLTGLVVCGHCQTKCVLKTGAQVKYYGCRHSSTGCSNHTCVRLDRIDQAIIDKIVETANAPDLEQVRKQEDNQTAAKIVELQHSLAELDKLKGIPHLQLTRSSIQQEIDELIRFKESSITADSTALQVIRHLQARNINFWYTLTQDEREILYLKLVDRVVLLGREAIQVELKQFAEPASNFDITQVTHYG